MSKVEQKDRGMGDKINQEEIDKIRNPTDTTVCNSNTPPQTVESPSAVAKCFALTEGNALVSVSAVMSFVGQ
jgi:hypothetical protein